MEKREMPEMPEKPEFPMRINRYLALNKYSTRRGADEIIKKGQVFINNKLAVLGDKVQATDRVEVKFRGKPAPYFYFVYNKPEGVGVTGEKVEAESSGKPRNKNGSRDKKLDPWTSTFPVGALEKGSGGLMIYTNDGRITERLLSPAHPHEKEYLVVTKNVLRSSFKKNMEAGVKIEGDHTEKCKVTILDENSFEVIFTDEKKHQLRRMCSALFQEVRYIQCTRIMNIELGSLREDAHREIKGEELKAFLSGLQL